MAHGSAEGRTTPLTVKPADAEVDRSGEADRLVLVLSRPPQVRLNRKTAA